MAENILLLFYIISHLLFAEDSFDFSWLFGEAKETVDIKVLVPNGMIVAVSKDDPTKIVWEHKVFYLHYKKLICTGCT